MMQCRRAPVTAAFLITSFLLSLSELAVAPVTLRCPGSDQIARMMMMVQSGAKVLTF